MDINYDRMAHSLNQRAMNILMSMQSEYSGSLNMDQIAMLQHMLENGEVVVVDQVNDEDKKFFSEQAGVTNPEEYSYDYVPSSHGARTKGDGKIHVYPHSKSFESCQSEEEILQAIINDILVHELFHYLIRANLSEDSNNIKDEFGHFLTEGLVQYYAEEYSKNHGLEVPRSGYKNNVMFSEELISGFPEGLSKQEIDAYVFSLNQDQLLDLSSKGQELMQKYYQEAIYRDLLDKFIEECYQTVNVPNKDQQIKGAQGHFRRIESHDDIEKELEQILKENYKDSPERLQELLEQLESFKGEIPFDIQNAKTI